SPRIKNSARGKAPRSVELFTGRESSVLAQDLIVSGPSGAEIQPVARPDPVLDRECSSRVIAQILLGILAPLPDPLVAIGIPGPRFLDHAGLHAQVDQLADL